MTGREFENKTKGVHRVAKRLGNGKIRKNHYAFRGVSKFWDSSYDYGTSDPRYSAALTDALRSGMPKSSHLERSSTLAILDRYRKSAHYKKLAERTR